MVSNSSVIATVARLWVCVSTCTCQSCIRWCNANLNFHMVHRTAWTGVAFWSQATASYYYSVLCYLPSTFHKCSIHFIFDASSLLWAGTGEQSYQMNLHVLIILTLTGHRRRQHITVFAFGRFGLRTPLVATSRTWNGSFSQQIRLFLNAWVTYYFFPSFAPQFVTVLIFW